jgi:1-acyl-sn-glycerol-3-phosphate acyltransferase
MVYFPGNEYHTPANRKRALGDRLAFNTRTYFVWEYIKVVLSSRKLALAGVYDTTAWSQSSNDIFELIEDCGGKFNIQGLENIHNHKEPVVYIGNHMSTLETMILPVLIAPVKEVTFVAKEPLVKHFFFGPILQARNPIVVGRTDSRADFTTVMDKGQDLLSKGMSVIIFPQSTRRVNLVPKEFNSLGVKLARAAKVPVIPIALKTNFWGNGKLMSHLGPIDRSKPIHIEFGSPFLVEGNGKDENNRIIEFIESRLKIWENGL